LFAKEDGLWAKMEWTPDGAEALKKRSFKYFSPEMFLNGDLVYEDPETHNVFNFVLDGGALTNFPYFKELNAVVMFSEPRLMKKFNEDRGTASPPLRRGLSLRPAVALPACLLCCPLTRSGSLPPMVATPWQK
jgi:phage I-like protein